MRDFSKTEKRKNESRFVTNRGKGSRLDNKPKFFNIGEARQLAEHVLSGIAWIG